MKRFDRSSTYREHARAALAGAYGWEKEVNTADINEDAAAYVDISMGTPIGDVNVLYLTGMAWPSYVAGAESGVELVCAATAEPLSIARILLTSAANLLVNKIEPRVGAYGRDYRSACELGDGMARHTLIVPPMFWDDDRDLFLGDFHLHTLQVVLITDRELAFFRRDTWEDFTEWMADANVDIANWDRSV